ncbi:hypothetical protein DFH08DRAFT_808006 [Mycena albidolilacea]|uniref:RRM domain-containing protein n=1 Tax=Mycena albidolilacea TaxID=1033008 RepID=A0AAD7A3P8_9AGAR|nr:hypothetical protein DFH08DRAFT_808006 [Mycena albidolilacea]
MALTKTNRKGLHQQELRRAPLKPNVFRAPSPSPTPSVADSSVAGPSIPAEAPPAMPPVWADQVTIANLVVRPRKKVTRAPERADLLVAAATARRRQVQLVQALQVVPILPVAPVPVPRLTSVAEPWVYGGNLDPEAIQVDLQEHFAPCGEIECVNFRYSSSGVPGHPQLGYRYAIIKFATAAAANAAVDLTGSKLMGSDYSLLKLPEFLKATRTQRHMLGGLPQHKVVAVLPDHKLQTASGMTVTSPVALVARTKLMGTSIGRSESGSFVVVWLAGAVGSLFE